MNFKAEQLLAKARTARLVLLFILAVAASVGMVYLYIILIHLLLKPTGGHIQRLALEDLWVPRALFWSALLIVPLMALGTIIKIIALRQGGPAVARLLGCRPIDPATSILGERRLLNIVGEMALASGIPAPQTWILDAGCINAFAAGYTLQDSVIGVTRGCMEFLNRDELQGVIAHEFSHIKNGDARLNIRLIGWLHGIIMIALLGEWLMNLFSLRLGVRLKQPDQHKLDIARLTMACFFWAAFFVLFAPLIVFGFMILGIGCTGQNVARVIRNSISRQRELLADAAAVDFTRNSEGLAGALKKIGATSHGARIEDPHAELVSHLFFCDSFTRDVFQSGSTHPDLRLRIWRLDPNWDGRFPPFSSVFFQPVNEMLGCESPLAALGGDPAAAAQGLGEIITVVAPGQDRRAAQVAGALPPQLQKLTAKDAGASVVLCALLLDSRPEVQNRQLDALKKRNDSLARSVAAVASGMGELALAPRLVLLDMALPALRRLGPERIEPLHAALSELAAADGQTRLFEFLLLRAVERLMPISQLPGAMPAPEEAATHKLVILSTLVHAAGQDPESSRTHFERLRRRLGLDETLGCLPRQACTLQTLSAAAESLCPLPAGERRTLIQTLLDGVAADCYISPLESQLLSLVALTLEIPLAVLLPGAADQTENMQAWREAEVTSTMMTE